MTESKWIIEIDKDESKPPAELWGAEVRDPEGCVHQTIEAPTPHALCDRLAEVLDSY